LGSGGNNTLTGSDLAATIRAFAGNDRIGAGRGADDIDAGSGNDSITSDDESSLRRGERDTVRCGPGRDTVVADRRDRISRGCERVIVRAL
jgi:Ca2+-binding RTX toxin-like protein